MAPEIVIVKPDMLSEYHNPIHKPYYGKAPKNEKATKLILNFQDKETYLAQIEPLQYYLKMGLKVKQAHRIIKFSIKEHG